MHTETTLRAAFEEYVARYPSQKAPRTLYEPVDYVISQSGKRIRPVLLLMSYSLFQDDCSAAMPAALAVEYFHNFTLVHDDIMDAATLRRGAKSVHAKFGTNAAILVGDLMLIRSYDLLLAACARADARHILGVFSDVAVRICEGQQLDMDFERRDAVDVSEYLEMIEKKTAVLLGGALQIGALLAGAAESDAELLGEAGVQLGKAFQIHDDILDAYGDEELVGKRRGGDILQRKKSILYALAWESSHPTARQSLADLYNKDKGNPEVKIQQVLGVFDKLNVKHSAEQMATHCYHQAAHALDRVNAPPARMIPLHDMAKEIFGRTY